MNLWATIISEYPVWLLPVWLVLVHKPTNRNAVRLIRELKAPRRK